MGLGWLAGMGDKLPASATQLHVAAAHSFRTSGVRSASPGSCSKEHAAGAKVVSGSTKAEVPGGPNEGRRQALCLGMCLYF